MDRSFNPCMLCTALFCISSATYAQKLNLMQHIVFRRSAPMTVSIDFENKERISKSFKIPHIKGQNSNASIDLDGKGVITSFTIAKPAISNRFDDLIAVVNKLIGTGKPDIQLDLEDKAKDRQDIVKVVLYQKGTKPDLKKNKIKNNGIETATDNATFYFWKRTK